MMMTNDNLEDFYQNSASKSAGEKESQEALWQDLKERDCQNFGGGADTKTTKTPTTITSLSGGNSPLSAVQNILGKIQIKKGDTVTNPIPSNL